MTRRSARFALFAAAICIALAPSLATAQAATGPFAPFQSWWLHPTQGTLGIFFDAHWVHQVLIGIAAPVSMWAIIRSGFWRQYQVGVPMVAGLLLLTVAAFFKPAEAFEAPISMIGATLLAFGHYRNSRLVRKLKQLAMTSRLAA